jgi:hypothetical protein
LLFLVGDNFPGETQASAFQPCFLSCHKRAGEVCSITLSLLPVPSTRAERTSGVKVLPLEELWLIRSSFGGGTRRKHEEGGVWRGQETRHLFNNTHIEHSLCTRLSAGSRATKARMRGEFIAFGEF